MAACRSSWPRPWHLANSMSSGLLGAERTARHRPRPRSGIQLGEASSRLPEGLVQLLWVGEEGHHQGVDHGEPTQPLLFIATPRLRKHQVQMLKKGEDGLVVHHAAACLGTSPSVDRALPTARLSQAHKKNTPVVQTCSGSELALQVPAGTERHRLQTRAHTSRLSASGSRRTTSSSPAKASTSRRHRRTDTLVDHSCVDRMTWRAILTR